MLSSGEVLAMRGGWCSSSLVLLNATRKFDVVDIWFSHSLAAVAGLCAGFSNPIRLRPVWRSIALNLSVLS